MKSRLLERSRSGRGARLFFFGTSAALSLAAGAAEFVGVSDVGDASSLTNKTAWSDASDWTAGETSSAAGYRTGVWQPNPAADYVFSKRGCMLRPPRFNDYRFIGRSLQLGTADGASATFGVGTSLRTAVQELDFSQSRLICANGAVSQYFTGATRILGPVEIVARPDVNGLPTFYFNANQQVWDTAGCNGGVALEFAGKVTGAVGTMAECRIFLYNESKPWENCSATNTVIRFTGDLSDCHATFVIRPWGNLAKDAVPIAGRRVTFSTSCAQMPGKLEVWRGGAIQLVGTETTFTVGELELCGDNLIEIPYDFDAGRGATLVTKSLTQTGKVRVRPVLTGTDDGTKAFAHALLKAPTGVTLNADDFVLDRALAGVPYTLSVANDSDGCSTLWLKHGVLVTLAKGDGGSGAGVSFSPESGSPHHWQGVAADEWPTDGQDYLNDGQMLRGANTPDDQTFGGDTLTLRSQSGNATLALRAKKSVTVNDLRVDASYGRDVTISHYATANKDTWPNTQSGICDLNGCARVASDLTKDGGVLFSLSTERGFRYGLTLSGEALVTYEGFCEKQSYKPNAYHWLTVANPDLTGKVRLCYKQSYDCTKSAYNYSWVPDEGITLPNRTFGTRVFIDDPLCFGGPEPTFTYDALQIEDYTILHPMRSMTFDDATRGIQIANNKAGGAPVARLDVTNDVVLTICQKINFTGAEATLVKEGEGLLAFGAGCRPTFGTEQSADPSVSSNNLFRILEGAFKPTAHGVCDGLQVSFGKDAKLVLDAEPTDSDLARYGLYNAAYRAGRTDRTGADVYPGRPLSLEEGATAYRVEIVKGSKARPPKKLGLFTVGAEFADDLVGRIVVEHPYPSEWMTEIVAETFDAPEHGGQLVTFSLRFRRGCALILR